MKPMRSGAARTALLENIALLTGGGDPAPDGPHFNMTQGVAILGGGINDALEALGVDKNKFWKIANHSTWRLFEAHRASGTLDKIK